MCVFSNLLIVNQTLHYVSSKQEELPPIFISWEKVYEGDQHLAISMTQPGNLPLTLWRVRGRRDSEGDGQYQTGHKMPDQPKGSCGALNIPANIG